MKLDERVFPTCCLYSYCTSLNNNQCDFLLHVMVELNNVVLHIEVLVGEPAPEMTPAVAENLFSSFSRTQPWTELTVAGRRAGAGAGAGVGVTRLACTCNSGLYILQLSERVCRHESECVCVHVCVYTPHLSGSEGPCSLHSHGLSVLAGMDPLTPLKLQRDIHTTSHHPLLCC